jgi:hypothetical protein
MAKLGPNHKDGCTGEKWRHSGTGYNRIRVCECGAEDHDPCHDVYAVRVEIIRITPTGVVYPANDAQPASEPTDYFCANLTKALKFRNDIENLRPKKFEAIGTYRFVLAAGESGPVYGEAPYYGRRTKFNERARREMFQIIVDSHGGYAWINVDPTDIMS